MEPPDPQDGRQVPQEYRSMCCGNDGIIRFVSIDGYHQDLSINDMKNMFLRTWSLTPNHKEWKQEAALCIGDLWSDTTHQKLPALMPTWPVHSILHADVVFLYLSGPILINTGKNTGEINTGKNTGETERYLVSINVQHREAISISKLSPDDSSPPPRYFPSSFNSYINKVTLDHFCKQAAGNIGRNSSKSKHKNVEANRGCYVQGNPIYLLYFIRA